VSAPLTGRTADLRRICAVQLALCLGAAGGRALSFRELAERTQFDARHLERALTSLVNARLVDRSGKPVARFCLLKHCAAISVAEVLQAVDGQNRRASRPPARVPAARSIAGLTSSWRFICRAIEDTLHEISLADLATLSTANDHTPDHHRVYEPPRANQ
jgi:DNA-binding IscR family transcriptional regulator